MADTAISTKPISLTAVTKIFRTGVVKKKTAIEDLTFTVNPGEVVGLLGANGSGKSTTIKLILGFLKPTQGEILVCGHSAEERLSRSRVGYLPENPRFQKFLTANNLLAYYGRLMGLGGDELGRRIDYLLDLVNLRHAGPERVQGFSKGMTQRLAIAQSLLNQPSLLIFDEPMSGLDMLGRMEIRKLIGDVHQEFPNTTIFFSTHILADVEHLCSSVILLKKGRLTQQCAIEDLLDDETQRFELLVNHLPTSLQEKWIKEKGAKASPSGLSVNVQGTDLLIEHLQQLRNAGAKVVGLTSQRKSLEEALFSDIPATAKAGPAKKAETGT